MDAEWSVMWERFQAMINGFIALLPNIVLALIVFVLFGWLAGAIKGFVKRLTRNRRQARNLGMVLGRLSQGTTILVGLFVALSIVIPSRRLEYDVGIGYGDDIDRAKQLILEAMHETDGVLNDPAPDAIVVKLARECRTMVVSALNQPMRLHEKRQAE